MGIQINGQTDTVTSTTAGGSVTVTPLAASSGLNVGTGASISSPATNVLTLGTNSAERIRINSSGTVGVNTTAVDSQLEVHSATSKINTVTIKTSAGASGYAGLAFMAGQTSAGREKAAIYFQETNGGAHYTGDIVFALNSTSGSAVQVSTSDERVRITSSGNLGIGITNPKGPIHTVNSSYKSLIISNTTTNSTGTGGVIAGDRYTKTNNPFVGFATWDNNTLRKAYVGGGGWNLPEATEIGLYTATTYDETTNAALERLKIDSSGRVTMPYQPYFYADMSSDFTTWVPNNQTQAIVYNRATINVGNHYSTTTGLFTAPVTGVYQFYVGVYSALTSFEQIWYLLNGTRMTSFVNGVTNSNQPGAFFVKLSANDTVGIHPYVNDGNNRTITVNGYHTFFYGHLVG